MTSVPARLAAFALLLAIAGGGAALAGDAVDPEGAEESAPAHGEASGTHAAPEPAAHAAADPPGLAVARDGLRLVLADDGPRRPGPTELRFTVVDADGRPVRDMDVEHDRRMHLLVVRRDLAVFRHLHPALDEDGAWVVRADLPQAGSYRVFADFAVDGESHTLGTDVHVAGDFAPRPLPAATTTARSDEGAEVRLRREGGRLEFDVIDPAGPADARLEPYLGAKGHLVVLRAGDLAFLHTHPDGDRLAFDVEVPSPGRFRAFVQFRLDGVVHTAAFTLDHDEVTR